MKSATRSDCTIRAKSCTHITERTRRAFLGIFRYFLANRVEMHYNMRIYPFLTGNLHASNARQRCSAKLEGDLTAQPLSELVEATATVQPPLSFLER